MAMPNSKGLEVPPRPGAIAAEAGLPPVLEAIPIDNPKAGYKRYKLIVFFVLVVAVLGVVIIGVVTSTRSRAGSAEVICPESLSAEELFFDENNIRRLQTDAPFQGIGCFQVQSSADNHVVEGSTEAEKAQACSERCLTLHFGVAGSDCFCYVEAPQSRLAIGSCAGVCEDERQKMEAYFKTGSSGECNQATTTAVRNFLVEEDDVPFGFDIVQNVFRASPFELYKDECGTNIYEVQTEISEGSNEVTTDVQEIKEFANERRSSLSRSISASASASYKGLFVKASAKVSASYDSEQNAMFKSSGGNEVGSQVFTSLGVKRIAEVTLLDFDNKRHFVTFSPQFGRLLRTYREAGFPKEVAEQIFDTYGMFVMTRGIFGGYMQLRTTATQSAVSRFFESKEDSRQCFEASVSGKAKGFGFKASFEIGAGQCTQDAAEQMQNLQNSYASESSEQAVVGGTVTGGEFVVPPELSQLLTTKDKYPAGDVGIQLRILSDFLSPEAVSPLEVKRYLLTEDDFSQIQENLQNHILEELQRLEGIIVGCGECEVPYLEQVDEGFQCVCYDPQRSSSPIAVLAGTYDYQLMFGGNNGSWGNGGSGTLTITEDGKVKLSDNDLTDFDFDPEGEKLEWKPHGEIGSAGNISFRESITSSYYYQDQTNDTAEHVFVGSLTPAGSGGLDFRTLP